MYVGVGEEDGFQYRPEAVAERLSGVQLAGPIRRYGDSIVVPVTRSSESEER